MDSSGKRNLFKKIGVSLVSIGLGIGSGEFILWPYISSSHGLSLFWGAILGIILQIILNIEIQKYSFISKKTIVQGAFNITHRWGLWFIVSTIIGFGWPGFASSSAYLLAKVLNFGPLENYLGVIILILTGLILISGKEVYLRVERLLKILVPISFLIVLIIFIRFFNIDQFTYLFNQAVSISNLNNALTSISLPVFLGAVVYSGSGGNLLLLQSFHILEKDSENSSYKENRRFQIFENIFIFGGLGVLTIFMLSYLGSTLTAGMDNLSNDLSFIVVQSDVIRSNMGTIFSKLFLLAGAFALFSVQLGVVDLLGRVTSQVVRLYRKDKEDSHLSYVISVILVVIVGVIVLLSVFNQPLWLIVTGSIFNAISMSSIAFITYLLSKTSEVSAKKNKIMQLVLLCISLFYAAFFVITALSII